MRLLLAVGFALAPAPALAQAYAARLYDDTEGLPSRSIWDVAQAPDGAIWVATRAGVARYDGARWEYHFTAEGLPFQRTLVFDPEGRLWTLTPTASARPLVFDGASWSRLPNGGPGTLAAEPTASVGWEGPDGFELVVGTTTGAVVSYRDGGWRHIEGLPTDERPIRSLHVWGGQLWAARADGVWTASTSTRRFVPSPLGEVGIPLALASAPDGASIWVVAERALWRWDGRVAVRVADDLDFDLYPENDMRYTAIVDPAGTVWFGNYTRMFQWSPETGARRLGSEQGLPIDSATGLLLDREHNIWIGSPRGLAKIASPRFVTYDSRHGLPADEVTVVRELDDGTMLLGQPRSITFLGGATLPIPGDSQRARVLDICVGPDGTIWVAANLAGLFRVAPDRTRLIPVPGPWEGATSVALGRRGTVWVGTLDGLYRSLEDGFERTTVRPADQRELYVRRVDVGRDGTVWAATGLHGVVRVVDDIGTRLEAPGDGADRAFATYESSDGEIYAATASGLLRVEGDRLMPVVPDPTPGHPVYTLTEDADGDLWLGTDHGVVVWDGERPRPLDRRHGLAGNETNRSAAITDRLGRVWIGTDAGVSVYRPEHDWDRPVGPSVSITAIEAGGESHRPGPSITLPAAAGGLTFQLSAPSFVDEERIDFRARLRGIDEDWTDLGHLPSRELRYSYLPPGIYRLDLQAISVEGQPGPVVESGTIVIQGPLWRRPWFLALAVAVTLGVVAVGATAVSRSRYAQRLELEVEARTKRLREAERELARHRHLDGLGALAGGIAHDFNNHLAAILGNLSLIRLENDDPQVAESVRDAIDAVGRARKLAGQLLTFSRGGAPVRSRVDVAAMLREVVADEKTGCSVATELPHASDGTLPSADPGQLRQALTEILRNACQAAGPEGRVAVRAEVLHHPHRLRVEIEDDGPGIPPGLQDQVFDPFFTTGEVGTGLGLTIADSIVRRHGGELLLASETGRTCVTLILPATPASPAPDEALLSWETRVPRPDEEQSDPAPSGPLRVLVMDDEESIRSLLARMLSRLGVECETSADGGEAVRKFEDARAAGKRFGVIILDLTVPDGMGGVETLHRIREIDPAVRAIVASGYCDDATLANARANGFEASIRKPFQLEDLAVELRRVAPPGAGL